MAKEVEDFDFGTADLEGYLAEVVGMNIIYRNKMRAMLAKADGKEMVTVKEFFEKIVTLEETKSLKIMTPPFRTGFVTLYNMNVKVENRIAL